jgi:hypothetical protein
MILLKLLRYIVAGYLIIVGLIIFSTSTSESLSRVWPLIEARVTSRTA